MRERWIGFAQGGGLVYAAHLISGVQSVDIVLGLVVGVMVSFGLDHFAEKKN